MSKASYALTATARLDLLQIWNYLAENASFEVADRTSAAIEAGIKKIARSPTLGHRRVDLTDRELFFYRVRSYLIIYRTDLKPLNILRVLHGARDVKTILAELP